MDPTTLAIGLFIAQLIQGGFSFFMKNILDKHTEDMKRALSVADMLRSELNDVKVTYVNKAEFGSFVTRLDERFDRLEDKLDQR